MVMHNTAICLCVRSSVRLDGRGGREIMMSASRQYYVELCTNGRLLTLLSNGSLPLHNTTEHVSHIQK